MNFHEVGLCVLLFGSIFVISSGYQSLSAPLQCNKGPSLWCQDIVNAKQCNAVRHCIQTVWEKQDVAEDNDSICQICLDMVKQARDQLESNETQSELKEVFEGSCRLIPIKPVQKECIKLADDFIPELVEALASQMNPQMVCSVAGLCNNAKIDKMLKNYKPATTVAPTTTTPAVNQPGEYKQRKLSCVECGRVADVIATKFKIADRDDMLESILQLCGQASSFSDACANIALTYFNDLYNYLSENANADGICHLSGTCSSRYHQHPENVEVRSRSEIGVVALKDDIPCELCQQLVRHLQEVLTANTTEIEFKAVLEGLCKQTQGFKTECLSIVDQYYDKIYNTLVHNLDANGACFLIGICPKGNSGKFLERRNIIPLIPYIAPAKIDVKIKKLPLQLNNVYSKEQINNMQLPIDKLMGAQYPQLLVENGELCTLCEYFLHFVQETLATPATEEKIKEAVNEVCNKFPTSLRGNCHNFVDMYGDAIIALIIQGVDPRQVCPELQMCPKNINADVNVFSPQTIDVSINGQNDKSDKPTCPLCLFAVQQAQNLIKDNKSKSNIKRVLDNLCSHLPTKLKTECVDFVETYSNELVDMLITDFTPQQICVYIKLCPQNSQDYLELANIEVDSKEEEDLSTEISEDVSLGGPECALCEKVIAQAEKMIGPKKTEKEIKDALYHACDKLHKMEDKCHKYITKHGDEIAHLILMEMTPKAICRELGYCLWRSTDESSSDEIMEFTETKDNVDSKDPPPCVLCEFVITKLEVELKDKKTQEEIKHEVEIICKKMPKTISASCEQFITKYGDLIISLLETVPPKSICQKLQLCKTLDKRVDDQVIECGVCHGATVTVVPYVQKQKDKVIDSQSMTEVGCDNLPAKYYKKCSELFEYFGESILNMIKTNTNQAEICSKIGMCFEEESSNLAYVKLTNSIRVRRDDYLLGANKCTYGPSHWCASAENAESCGTTSFCEKKIWKNGAPKA